jgi:hypothetical protein
MQARASLKARSPGQSGPWEPPRNFTPMNPAPKIRPSSDAAVATEIALNPSPAPADTGAEAWTNRRASEQAHRAAAARQASGRRRFVDPTTCEREYSIEEIEFMHAMQEYKKSSGRMFPTWSEVLEVIRALGYEKGERIIFGDVNRASSVPA